MLKDQLGIVTVSNEIIKKDSGMRNMLTLL